MGYNESVRLIGAAGKRETSEANMSAITLLSAFNWYGFLIGSGMVICIIIAYFLSVKRGYYSDLVFDIVIICIPLAIVGARLYYVIFDAIDGGEWTFKKILGLEGGGLAGLAIYGGLIGAVLGGAIVAALQRRRKEGQRVTFVQMADLAFTVIILGQAIGRWGNFANGEAYGTEVTNPALQWFPFAVNINGVYHLATFFYESIWNLIGFFLLLWLYHGRRKSFDGFVLSVYCIWYGLGRFFIEGLRTDSLWLIPQVVRVSQLVSALIFVFGIVYILAHMYRARSRGLKPFIFVPVEQLDEGYFEYDKSQIGKPPMENNRRKKKKDDLAAEEVEEESAPPESESTDVEESAPPEPRSGDGEETPTDAPTDLTETAEPGGTDEEEKAL